MMLLWGQRYLAQRYSAPRRKPLLLRSASIRCCRSTIAFMPSKRPSRISRDRQCQPVEAGDNLAQEFKSLSGKIGRLDRQASDVAARPRQTCDQAAADRVVRYCKDDGDNRCRLLYHGDGNSRRDNDVDLQADELGRDLGVAFGTSLGPAILDCDSAIVDPTEFTQSLRKGSSVRTPGRSVRAHESDDRHFARLLRARRERPCRRTSEQCDERAPVHS